MACWRAHQVGYGSVQALWPSAIDALCSAPHAAVNGGGATVGAIQTHSTNGWQIDQAASGFVGLPAPAPTGVTVPGGATKVVFITSTAGSSATATLRFSSIPAGAQFYKYGKENGVGDTKIMVFLPSHHRHGGGHRGLCTDRRPKKGDNDWTQNSVIDDPAALDVNGSGNGRMLARPRCLSGA